MIKISENAIKVVGRTHYNLFGERISVIDPGSVGQRYDYDRRGLLAKTASAQAADVFNTSTHTVNDANVLTLFVARRILETRYTYDQLGRRISTTDANNKTSWQQYDLDGNVIRTTSALGYAGDSGGRYSNTARFDSFRHQIQTTDAEGNSASWSVDSFGRIHARTDLGGGQYTYRFDRAGQQVQQTLTRNGQTAVTTQEWQDGLLTKITDGANGQTTTYRYDLANNRIREKITVAPGTYGGTAVASVNVANHSAIGLSDGSIQYQDAVNVLQDNTLTYDTQNRLIDIKDSVSVVLSNGVYHVSYGYDANGNRTRVTTEYDQIDATTKKVTQHVVQDAWNTYDSQNRQLIVNGIKDGNNNIVLGADSHKLAYDTSGNRISDTFIGTRVVSSNGTLVYQDNVETTESYGYDQVGRLLVTTRDGVVRTDFRHYDALGRVTESGFLRDDFQPFASKQQEVADRLKLAAQKITYTYDDDGRLLRQKLRTISGSALDDIYFFDPRINDGKGAYDRVGNLKGYINVRASGGSLLYGIDYAKFDVYKEQFNGFSTNLNTKIIDLTSNNASAVASRYDLNGNRISIREGSTVRNNYRYDSAGHVIYRESGDGQSRDYSLIANGEDLGYEDRKTSTYLGSTYLASQATTGTGGGGAYVTRQQGEKLTDIAKAIWGDASLWYLLADANGINGSSVKDANTVLSIPQRSTTLKNNAETIRPYNLNDALGNTAPTAPPPKGGGGCGGAGRFLSAVVTIAVTAFLTTITGGLGGAFLSGVAGSVAGQATGIALGVQDGFSLKQAVRAGIGNLAGQAFKGYELFDKTATTANAVARAVISNTVTQGVSIAVGLQKSFDWRGVVASGVGAGVGQFVGETLKDSNLFKSFGSGQNFAKGVATSFAAGTATAVARGGKLNVVQVVVDVFGNSLGGALAAAVTPQTPAKTLANFGDETSNLRLRSRNEFKSFDFNLAQAGGFDLSYRNAAPDTNQPETFIDNYSNQAQGFGENQDSPRQTLTSRLVQRGDTLSGLAA